MSAVDGVVGGTLWDGYMATRSKIGYFMGCGRDAWVKGAVFKISL
jgi:hypothetical protein